MKNIRKIVFVLILSSNYVYASKVSDYYLFKFHTELPLHYRAEMFLLDAQYQRAISKPIEDGINEFFQIFEHMEYIISRLDNHPSAQNDYQVAVREYKNKMIALQKK